MGHAQSHSGEGHCTKTDVLRPWVAGVPAVTIFFSFLTRFSTGSNDGPCSKSQRGGPIYEDRCHSGEGQCTKTDDLRPWAAGVWAMLEVTAGRANVRRPMSFAPGLPGFWL